MPQLQLKYNGIVHHQPDILVVDIASNELCATVCGPLHLAQQVFNIVTSFIDIPSVKCVFIIDV